MKNKFILFSKKVHEALIEEGYHTVKTTELIPGIISSTFKRKGLNGYLIEVNRYKNPDENGRWVYKFDGQEIIKYHWYSSDPNDPETIEFYNRYPIMRPKDTSGLTGKAKVKADIRNTGRNGRTEIASPDINITEVDVEYPLTIDKVKEMYGGTAKFYIRLDVGYNKPGFRKTKYRLYKRLVSCSAKFPRILRNE